MTDGAGYVNKIVLLTLRTRLDLVTFPTGLQCRFDGWKVSICWVYYFIYPL
jgi:hypothetical protein